MTKATNISAEVWKKVKLKEVLVTSIGSTPRTSKKAYWDNGIIPWLNSGALKDEIISEPTTYITELGFLESSVKLFPAGSVLVALTGSTIGKLGLLGFPSTTNQSVCGIYPSRYLSPKFLFYYFTLIRPQLKSKAIGAAQPHINKSIIDNTELPIPPVAHQKKTVQILDEVFAKQSSIRGKVAAIEQLENVALQEYLINEDESYPEIAIGDFCTERNERVGSSWKGKKLLGVSKDMGVIELRVGEKQRFEKYKIVFPGDFVYNPMRINIGSIGIYEGENIALTSPDYIVFHVNNTVSKRFLFKFLKSVDGQNIIEKNTRGSVRSRLYFSSLSQIKIPFCGVECQAEAEITLEHFQRMRKENELLLKQLDTIVHRTLEDCFNQRILLDSNVRESSDDLIALMMQEKSQFVNVSKTRILPSHNVEQKGNPENPTGQRFIYPEQTGKHQAEKTKSPNRRNNSHIKISMLKNTNDPDKVKALITKHYSRKRFTSTELMEILSVEGDDYDSFKDILFSLLQEKINEVESPPFLEAIYDAKQHQQFLKIKNKV